MPNDPHNNPSFFGRISARSSLTSSRDCKATVQLLDDSDTITQEFKKNQNGKAVLDYVCEYLNIIEKDYFGLRYQDFNKHRYWLDLKKPISKQIHGSNLGLRFRVRFYPSDISVLTEEITRYQLFVQLQRDLLHGRLYCPQNEAAILGALILQSHIGDYNPEVHAPGYVSEYKLLLKQTTALEDKIAIAHETFKGLSPADAEMEFLKKASKLDTYGFDPFTVMDKQGQTVFLGVTHKGIFVYHVNRMVHRITWDELEKVDYVGKELLVTPVASYKPVNENSPGVFSDNNDNVRDPALAIASRNGNVKHVGGKPVPLKFRCPSGTFAKHLWRHILSQQAFFTENDAKHVKPKFSKPRIPLLSRGSTFRCPTSRVFHEIEVEGPHHRDGPPPVVARYPLQKQPARLPSSFTNKYHTLPPMHIGNSCSTTIPEVEDTIMEMNETTAPECTISPIQEEGSCTTSPSFSESTSVSPHITAEDAEVLAGSQFLVRGGEESVLAPLVSSLQEAEPLSSSTPCREEVQEKRLVTTEEATPVEPTGEPSAPGLSVAPRVVCAEPAGVATSGGRAKRVVKAVAKLFCSCLLISLLIAALAIAFFESGSTYLSRYPLVDDVRHTVYEPAREYLMSKYEQIGRF